MIVGSWRIRPRWHVRAFSGLWFNRTRYTEGTVYRAAIGRVQITVMVDAMTVTERARCEAKREAIMALLAKRTNLPSQNESVTVMRGQFSQNPRWFENLLK